MALPTASFFQGVPSVGGSNRVRPFPAHSRNASSLLKRECAQIRQGQCGWPFDQPIDRQTPFRGDDDRNRPIAPYKELMGRNVEPVDLVQGATEVAVAVGNHAVAFLILIATTPAERTREQCSIRS